MMLDIDTTGSRAWEMTLFSGEMVDIAKITDDQIKITDIAHALSLNCRFGGHCKYHYSIATHSCHVADMVYDDTGEPKCALAALLHDASEAYLQDIVRGCKQQMPAYCEMERELQRRIYRKFGINDACQDAYHDVIKEWDNAVLKAEAIELIAGGPDAWFGFDKIEAAPIQVFRHDPFYAERVFLSDFNHYRECAFKT